MKATSSQTISIELKVKNNDKSTSPFVNDHCSVKLRHGRFCLMQLYKVAKKLNKSEKTSSVGEKKPTCNSSTIITTSPNNTRNTIGEINRAKSINDSATGSSYCSGESNEHTNDDKEANTDGDTNSSNKKHISSTSINSNGIIYCNRENIEHINNDKEANKDSDKDSSDKKYINSNCIYQCNSIDETTHSSSKNNNNRNENINKEHVSSNHIYQYSNIDESNSSSNNGSNNRDENSYQCNSIDGSDSSSRNSSCNNYNRNEKYNSNRTFDKDSKIFGKSSATTISVATIGKPGSIDESNSRSNRGSCNNNINGNSNSNSTLEDNVIISECSTTTLSVATTCKPALTFLLSH